MIKNLISIYSTVIKYQFYIKEVLKNQPYFPRVDEIVKYLPTKQEQEEPGWFYQNLENNLPTKQEQEEMKNILDELTEE